MIIALEVTTETLVSVHMLKILCVYMFMYLHIRTYEYIETRGWCRGSLSVVFGLIFGCEPSLNS